MRKIKKKKKTNGLIQNSWLMFLNRKEKELALSPLCTIDKLQWIATYMSCFLILDLRSQRSCKTPSSGRTTSAWTRVVDLRVFAISATAFALTMLTYASVPPRGHLSSPLSLASVAALEVFPISSTFSRSPSFRLSWGQRIQGKTTVLWRNCEQKIIHNLQLYKWTIRSHLPRLHLT